MLMLYNPHQGPAKIRGLEKLNTTQVGFIYNKNRPQGGGSSFPIFIISPRVRGCPIPVRMPRILRSSVRPRRGQPVKRAAHSPCPPSGSEATLPSSVEPAGLIS